MRVPRLPTPVRQNWDNTFFGVFKSVMNKENQQKFLAYLDMLQMSMSEFWLLHVCAVHDCCLLQEQWRKVFFEYCEATSELAYAIDPPVPNCCTHKTFQDEFAKLLEKNLLFQYSSKHRDAIKLLFGSRLLTHTERLPQDNEIGISPLGLAVLRELETIWGIREKNESEYVANLFTTTWNSDTDDMFLYSFSEDGIKDGIEINSFCHKGSSEHCGPIAIRWWEIFPSGFRISISQHE